MPAKKRSTLKWLFGIINFTAIASCVTAIVAIIMASFSISHANALIDKEKKLDWQKVIVYSIIEKGEIADDKHGQKGLTFEQIKERYRREVGDQLNIYKELPVTIADLNDITLRAILLELSASNQVQVHKDKTWYVNWYYHHCGERTVIETKMRDEIIRILTVEGGKYTVDELRQKIGQDAEAFNYQINALIANNIVVVMAQGKGNETPRTILYTVANTPIRRISVAAGEK